MSAREPPPPSPFSGEEYARWRRNRRLYRPPWWADFDYVTTYALELLPRVASALELGNAVCTLPRPAWWRTRVEDPRAALHFPPPPEGYEPVIVLRLEPDGYDLLFIDRATGEWEVPNLSALGPDLVSLAAWRWGIAPTKAAWKLARVCGLRQPRP